MDSLKRVVLRLSDEERCQLKVLNAALAVCEYTDDVDGMRLRYRESVENEKINSMGEFFTTIIGLMMAGDLIPKPLLKKLKDASSTIRNRDKEPLLRKIFEVGRRYKRFNPYEMKDYGKLLMVLQDSNSLKDYLGIESFVGDIETVGGALKSIDAMDLLTDPRLKVATEPLEPDARPEMREEKAASFKALVDEYSIERSENNKDKISPEDRYELIGRCLRSIDDSKTFLKQCCESINILLRWLDEYFPDDYIANGGVSIEIKNGVKGSTLTHSHTTHRQYVKESLILWKIIQRDILDFWACVEHDMIVDPNGSKYRFVDTGQGYHRMAHAPTTYVRMQRAIDEAHQTMNGWVGIKVVHLGDKDVPNALIFIDKYTVIPRLISPVVRTIEALEEMFDPSKPERYPGVRNLLKTKYGSFEKLRLDILSDFFKHAFDGSGDSGGSCIDGRLTSAWNWCSLLHKKKYYLAFILTGFVGFD